MFNSRIFDSLWILEFSLFVPRLFAEKETNSQRLWIRRIRTLPNKMFRTSKIRNHFTNKNPSLLPHQPPDPRQDYNIYPSVNSYLQNYICTIFHENYPLLSFLFSLVLISERKGKFPPRFSYSNEHFLAAHRQKREIVDSSD